MDVLKIMRPCEDVLEHAATDAEAWAWMLGGRVVDAAVVHAAAALAPQLTAALDAPQHWTAALVKPLVPCCAGVRAETLDAMWQVLDFLGSPLAAPVLTALAQGVLVAHTGGFKRIKEVRAALSPLALERAEALLQDRLRAAADAVKVLAHYPRRPYWLYVNTPDVEPRYVRESTLYNAKLATPQDWVRSPVTNGDGELQTFLRVALGQLPVERLTDVTDARIAACYAAAVGHANIVAALQARAINETDACAIVKHALLGAMAAPRCALVDALVAAPCLGWSKNDELGNFLSTCTVRCAHCLRALLQWTAPLPLAVEWFINSALLVSDAALVHALSARGAVDFLRPEFCTDPGAAQACLELNPEHAVRYDAVCGNTRYRPMPYARARAMLTWVTQHWTPASSHDVTSVAAAVRYACEKLWTREQAWDALDWLAATWPATVPVVEANNYWWMCAPQVYAWRHARRGAVVSADAVRLALHPPISNPDLDSRRLAPWIECLRTILQAAEEQRGKSVKGACSHADLRALLEDALAVGSVKAVRVVYSFGGRSTATAATACVTKHKRALAQRLLRAATGH